MLMKVNKLESRLGLYLEGTSTRSDTNFTSGSVTAPSDLTSASVNAALCITVTGT